MGVIIDVTDVTLVSEDTYERPYPDDPREHDDPDDHDDRDDPDAHDYHDDLERKLISLHFFFIRGPWGGGYGTMQLNALQHLAVESNVCTGCTAVFCSVGTGQCNSFYSTIVSAVWAAQ